jgi:hypothetical protein
MTDNHNYETPSAGTTDWHVPINKNFERMDSDIEVRDVESNLSQYTPRSGSKFMSTDTGRVFIADGDDWTRVDSSGPDPTYLSVSARSVNGVVFAKEFQGSGLASKISNALNWLKETGGQGRIRVTAKEDGTAWKWDKEITIDPTDYVSGVHVDVDQMVKIDYSGDQYPITIDHHGEPSKGYLTFQLYGGHWTHSGQPAGWIRLIDANHTKLCPKYVECRNSSTNATAIKVEAKETWAEANRISGTYRADRGIDWDPSTNASFADTAVDNAHFNVWDFGLRLRGNFRCCKFSNLTIFTKNDGARGIILDSPDMIGTVFDGWKIEDPGPSNSDVAAFETQSNYMGFYGPTFLGGRVTGISTAVDDTAGNNERVVQLSASDNGFKIVDLQSGVDELNVQKGNLAISGGIESEGFTADRDGSIRQTARDLASLSLDSEDDGKIFRHDGSSSVTADGSSSNDAGYYKWDNTDGEFKFIA